ncbi:tannase and feruloyl esterase-domain-containing protein [Chaetomium tenue]|uniref:Tannase and feruloyl esterase-domain-containing protein n=1 Tax=Chaetomium tenue TaxID=1854479 RepID=A0ACB7P566_9PEZI|nr:tannase and feruloyl esterase-domain-containing protein [Chaetomium globosum]
MLLFLTTFLLGLAATTAATTTTTTKASCSNIPTPIIPGLTILSLTSTELLNHTVPATPPFLNTPVTNLNVCAVTVTLTHPGANDTVNIQIWLPLPTDPSTTTNPSQPWNNRFIALGGSGWSAGHGPPSIAPYAFLGFAAATTDAGLPASLASITTPSAWALSNSANGTVNTALLTNFASRSVHDLAVRWAGDFDGVVVGAPAVYWARYVVAELWPQVVMGEVGYFPEGCELEAVRADVVEVCDGLDGVRDGVVGDVVGCGLRYDPGRLVGRKVKCGDGEVVVTSKLVEVVKKIWEGPKTASGEPLWYGLPADAPLTALAETQDVNGTHRTGAPFFVARDWVKYFVKADPSFDLSGLNSTTLREVFDESVNKFASVIDSSDADLSGFRNAGGKLLVWHGGADNIIFPQDSIRYHSEVQKTMGLSQRGVDDFFRLFIAPGVDHCAQGSIDGAGPTDALGALMEWVEKGRAPGELAAATLDTAKTRFTRKLCPYPLVARVLRREGESNQSSFDWCPTGPPPDTAELNRCLVQLGGGGDSGRAGSCIYSAGRKEREGRR